MPQDTSSPSPLPTVARLVITVTLALLALTITVSALAGPAPTHDLPAPVAATTGAASGYQLGDDIRLGA